MENIQTRMLNKSDVPAIDRIYAAIINKPDKIDFNRIIAEHSENQVIVSFAAELGHTVVGFMICYTITAGFGIDKSAWISMLGVDPKHMGKGIGKKLAQAMFEFCRKKGIKNIYTSVPWDSTDMLSFFMTLDFDRSNFINLRKTLE